MHRLLSASLVMACFALCSTQASADTVQLNSWTNGWADVSVFNSIDSHAYSGAAGGFSGQLNGGTFQTYCVDLYQSFNWGTTYTDYSVVALSTTVSHDLARLFTSHLGDVVDGNTSAAFQLATWEIMYEQGGSYNLSAGNFTESGNATVHNIAQGYLDTLGQSAIYTVQKLESPTSQDFVLTTAVPEPSSYAMLAAGLGLIGWIKRRKA
ncbi:PEP-CTERM sorting domain-containing protein [Duganella sp. FT135W]|uniref:PEP-CTERM sorting domain-containing protein n=1 Tax=Duganella flavida TaxID=2692175 RepID=A0A6L8KGB5_9BURK|nr:PEP-CTERM sorting domain-containing protein [Duganella flavida]MYM26060.1 PEP-CTERM sorting domain-containing protein [Duganella flavida]